jgi:hypothetical protein
MRPQGRCHSSSARRPRPECGPRMSPGSRAATQYDWNLLPMGQALWLKELETYIDFPPLQNPASYNLDQVMQPGG